MVKLEHIIKLNKILSAGGEGMNLAHSFLCAIALGEKLSPGFYKNKESQRVLGGLRRYKFVRRTKSGEGNSYTITEKGENKLQKILIDEVIINHPRKWDGKWRIVMYDLPIRFRKAREAFRWKLKDLGFVQLQKSTWIYPYPCEGELLFVADFFGVRKHIEILEVVKLLDDKKLKTYFGL